MAPVSADVEIARGAMAAFSRGDLEEGLGTLYPAVEWHLAFRLPDLPPGRNLIRIRPFGEREEAFAASGIGDG